MKDDNDDSGKGGMGRGSLVGRESKVFSPLNFIDFPLTPPNAPPLPTLQDSVVRVLAVAGSRVYIGGSFCWESSGRSVCNLAVMDVLQSALTVDPVSSRGIQESVFKLALIGGEEPKAGFGVGFHLFFFFFERRRLRIGFPP